MLDSSLYFCCVLDLTTLVKTVREADDSEIN